MEDNTYRIALLRSQTHTRSIGRQLSNYGFKTSDFPSETPALDLIKNCAPDCLIVDFHCEIAASNLCTALRADALLQSVPILAMSEHSAKEHVLLALEVGANSFLAIDTHIDLVVSQVYNLLRIKALHDQLLKLKHYEAIHNLIGLYNHEFNNPLTIAYGQVALLKTQAPDSAAALLLHLEQTLDRIANLVKKLSQESADILSRQYINIDKVKTDKVKADKKSA